jgi:23S rRNA (cytosine1962-C5)-methyltransferase
LSVLETAWNWRKEKGCFENTEALRVFHGPGEGEGKLRSAAIDRFGENYWVTYWGNEKDFDDSEIISFLRMKFAHSAVVAFHPSKGEPKTAKKLFGDVCDSFIEHEEGLKFQIRFHQVKHPGLFLDHIELRRWLRSNLVGKTVLNTFAYTGSLSVAAGVGKASHVTTLDLSKPTIEWAKENWKLNNLDESKSDFIFGDVFEWLPKFEKKKRKFDCVILDPPSFSRSKKGTFSTSKDLGKLHQLAVSVLNSNGLLVTSINSATISLKNFASEVMDVALKHSSTAKIIRRLGLPPTFPKDDYLKGLIVQL